MDGQTTEPANREQLRLLVSLHNQLGVSYDAADLATLSKWEAAERINILRGRPATRAEDLDEALLEILRLRAEALGDDPDAAAPARRR